jgi:hypothetical protein
VSATGLLFAAIFASLTLLALARHPIYGAMAYVLTLFVSPADRWWGQDLLGDIRWSLLAASVTALGLLIHRPSRPAGSLWKNPLALGIVAFVIWVAIQSLWAYSADMHRDLLIYYVKVLLAIYLIYSCLESERHLRLILWAYLAGCGYLAFVANASHTGGRFDSFGGAGIGDANSSALALTTGVLVAASLFLIESWKYRAVILVLVPLIVNAIVATISRSGFLSLAVGAILFNILSPPDYRKVVRVLSVLGLAGFLLITNADYWARIGTIKYAGDAVEGVDTGSKRLVLIAAQKEMFMGHPMGCGARCTDVLSPRYLSPEQLAGKVGEEKARSSHNTFMTMAVDHGVIGAALYILMIVWLVVAVAKCRSMLDHHSPVIRAAFPAVAGSLGCIIIGDLFVQYPKLEIRFWMLLIMIWIVGVLSAESARKGALLAPDARANASRARNE